MSDPYRNEYDRPGISQVDDDSGGALGVIAGIIAVILVLFGGIIFYNYNSDPNTMVSTNSPADSQRAPTMTPAMPPAAPARPAPAPAPAVPAQ